MMASKFSSSALMAVIVALGVVSPVSGHASEADAREVFSVAAAGGMTFTGSRAVEDVGVVFLHFTSAGRSALIGELERTGLVAEVVSKRAAIRADLPVSAIQVRRRAGSDGLDEYELSGEMRLQWSRCAAAGCTSVGVPKKVSVTGTVVQMTMNGRPAYRVSSIRYEGAR